MMCICIHKHIAYCHYHYESNISLESPVIFLMVYVLLTSPRLKTILQMRWALMLSSIDANSIF